MYRTEIEIIYIWVFLYPTIFFPMARRASDEYIQLNKKITSKEVIKAIKKITEKTKLSTTEVCYRLIHEGALNYESAKMES
jgi:hypothetical protein